MKRRHGRRAGNGRPSASPARAAGAARRFRRVGGASGGKPNLTVSARRSLKEAFTAYAQQFPRASVRFSFAGSDVLAAQIEQGVKPDVFASANTKLPDMLYAKGLVSKPVTFAANKLVIAVPAGSTKVRSVSDLEKPGVTIAIGSATVPIGSYTRKVLAKLGPAASAKILANVRSEEPDVSGIVGQAHPGRGRRRLHLRHRREGDQGRAEGDRACRRRCSRSSPTASRSSRVSPHPAQAAGVHRRAAERRGPGRPAATPGSCHRPRSERATRGSRCCWARRSRSRWPSWCCRSSRSSPTPRRRS